MWIASPHISAYSRARVFQRARLILTHLIPPDAAVLAAAAPPLAAAIPAVVAIPMSPLPRRSAPGDTSIAASSPHLSDERSPAMKSGMTASVHRPTCVMDWVSRFAPPSVVIYAIPTALKTPVSTAPGYDSIERIGEHPFEPAPKEKGQRLEHEKRNKDRP